MATNKKSLNSFFRVSPLILQTAIWPIVRPLFWFFLRLEIHGLDNLLLYTNYKRPRDICVGDSKQRTEDCGKCGVIFAVNHSSELDPILVPASLPFLSPLMPFFYTSREQSFYKTSSWRQFFYGGFLFTLWGSHSLHSGTRNYEESLATHIRLLEDGKSVCIFPEGRKTKDGSVGAIAHGGVAYLSFRTHAPVIPVRIKGVFQLTAREFLLRRRSVSVVFGQPLSPADLFYTNYKRSRDICVGDFLQNVSPPSLAEIKAAAQRVLGEIQRL